jgi:DNA-binding NarL/FixJ family response regulator
MESQWARAAPWQQDDDGWQPVLRLLEQGLSDRAIADALGASVRTVQRRITEAMTYFDVSSRFELGAAWARHSVSDN